MTDTTIKLPIEDYKATSVTQTPVKKTAMSNRYKKSEETKLGWLPNTSFSERQKGLIRRLVAPTLNDDEFNLFIYRCLSLRLDPLKQEISVHKRKEHTKWCKGGKCDCPEKMVVVVGRDGFLTIAHRSGEFGGMETETIENEKGEVVKAKCTVWNKSAPNPFVKTVRMSEYNSQTNVWKFKPVTMLEKVAESQALKRAFNIEGVYSEEELDSWGGTSNGKTKEIPVSETDSLPATAPQHQTIKSLGGHLDDNATQKDAKEEIAKLLEKK